MYRQKKGTVLLLTAMLLIHLAKDNAAVFTAEEMMNCYTGLSGSITFALPGQIT